METFSYFVTRDLVLRCDVEVLRDWQSRLVSSRLAGKEVVELGMAVVVSEKFGGAVGLTPVSIGGTRLYTGQTRTKTELYSNGGCMINMVVPGVSDEGDTVATGTEVMLIVLSFLDSLGSTWCDTVHLSDDSSNMYPVLLQRYAFWYHSFGFRYQREGDETDEEYQQACQSMVDLLTDTDTDLYDFLDQPLLEKKLKRLGFKEGDVNAAIKPLAQECVRNKERTAASPPSSKGSAFLRLKARLHPKYPTGSIAHQDMCFVQALGELYEQRAEREPTVGTSKVESALGVLLDSLPSEAKDCLAAPEAVRQRGDTKQYILNEIIQTADEPIYLTAAGEKGSTSEDERTRARDRERRRKRRDRETRGRDRSPLGARDLSPIGEAPRRSSRHRRDRDRD
ncbi:unnamed protein product [Vitrella brassicaformis CCMP3155]|uniref:Uncharacterized protein n=1 Tax=Vitrella brassicaformis (strain CCMP3155) TaxID=1169540 RepID=A0A0G4FGY2_VITBC|nr:unnamed protein product [Vitrella brassicaformis CCMP3155]|eukprot:CEM12715.1 unnamed protein product [Vitrella brassicaformis CCMP3155]